MDTILKGKREFITYLLDKNRSPLPIVDVRFIDVIGIIHMHDDKHDNHTRSSCASFARLRFRYLIFYCSFIMRVHTTGFNEGWILPPTLSTFYIFSQCFVLFRNANDTATVLKHRRSFVFPLFDLHIDTSLGDQYTEKNVLVVLTRGTNKTNVDRMNQISIIELLIISTKIFGGFNYKYLIYIFMIEFTKILINATRLSNVLKEKYQN